MGCSEGLQAVVPMIKVAQFEFLVSFFDQNLMHLVAYRKQTF